MKDDKILEKLMSDPKIRNLGLKEEVISSIINSYNDRVLDSLLENGHIEINNGMNIEVVRLISRVHVLRGVEYHSNRKYKLKLTMEENLYEKIEKYYDDLEKEIE